MKKFYLHNGNEQQGPFDFDDLKAKGIAKETPIWHEGLKEWTIAEKIDELKSIFKSVAPPPFNVKAASPPVPKTAMTYAKSTQSPSKNKNKIIGRILSLIGFLLLAIPGIFIVYNMSLNNSRNSGSSGESYQEKILTVEEIERTQPTNFLTVSGNYNKNFWGDKINVQGVIENRATVAKYKDAVVKVTYYSKTNTPLAKNNYTIYDVFSPRSQIKFTLKIENYQNVSSIGLDIISAIPN